MLNVPSALAILGYAVDHLGVKNVIVVGHSECGGVAAVMSATEGEVNPNKHITGWLNPLSQLDEGTPQRISRGAGC